MPRAVKDSLAFPLGKYIRSRKALVRANEMSCLACSHACAGVTGQLRAVIIAGARNTLDRKKGFRANTIG